MIYTRVQSHHPTNTTMGDLDDFFAKKDKKKKGGKKFSKANAEVIAKNLIETDRKELKEQERQDKELGSQLSEEKVAASNNNDDEEWDDYRENKKDYTGLKIDTLTIEEQPQEEEEEETEINEDGERVKVKKDDSGPWNKNAAAAAAAANNESQQDLVQEAEPPIQTPNVVKGSYVPPHMRGGAGSEATARVMERKPLPRGGRNRAAPDLSSEVFFPSLSSAAEEAGPKGAWKKSAKRSDHEGGQFEEVRERGSQAYSRQHAEAPRLALGNKFDALRD